MRRHPAGGRRGRGRPQAFAAFDDDAEFQENERLEAMEGRLRQEFTQQMEELSNKMTELLHNRTPTKPESSGDDSTEEDNWYFARNRGMERNFHRRDDHWREDDRRWETGMRTEIPEFHGGLQAEEFLDWLATMEEILEFKAEPEERRVPLVATRLRGRATAWWQQLKLRRDRMDKDKIRSWKKLKHHMRSEFLPHNYQRLIYGRLHNLRQGSKSVEEYTNEFYQLLARNDVQESTDQLVARYFGGLRLSIQDFVNIFDLISLSSVHQQAVIVEKQLWCSHPAFGGSRFSDSKQMGGNSSGPSS